MSNIKLLRSRSITKIHYPKKVFNTSQKNIGIIPHYRENISTRIYNNFEVIDIDNHPIYIAKGF